MRIWTRQDIRVLETLENNGVYYCKPEYIENKMENFSEYYKKLYKWYVAKAESIVPRPSPLIEYPIWVSVDEEIQLQSAVNTVILELEVPQDQVVITDQEKWGYVVNYFYLPLGPEDLEAYNLELKKYGINDESSLIMGHKGNFYPILKQKIMKSWDRLFEPYTLSNLMQGTIWEIRKEWIIDYKKSGTLYE